MRVRVAARINIEQSPPVVFALVTDIAHQPDWSAAVEKVTDLTDEPPRLGTTWTQVTSLLGHRVEARARVVGMEQDRQFAYRIDRPAPVQMTWYLDAISSGTHVEVVAEGEAGLFAALLRPMLGPLKEALDGDLGRLKDRLEAP
ncbi:MAG: SRPBCC family protein [Chloroflexota bacterium]